MNVRLSTKTSATITNLSAVSTHSSNDHVGASPVGNSNEAENDPLLTVEQLAARIQCSPKTIYRMVKAGKIPYLRLGKLIRFRQSDVVEYLRRTS
ncbi:MAG: DNA-binding protein [Hyphomicrobiales bacterium]|nr:MAG: DNA-binding protein [Hyphomicrobiales bacterium]